MDFKKGVRNILPCVLMTPCKNVSRKLVCKFQSKQLANICFNYSIENHFFRTMACSLKPCRVAPVGLAFAQYKKDFGTEEPEEFMKLFQHDEDDHHSSNKGSYLAACVHYSMIFGEPCTGNSYQRSWRAGKDSDKTYTITKANTRKLQETADKIVGTKDLRMNYVFHKSNDKCQRSACPLSSIL